MCIFYSVQYTLYEIGKSKIEVLQLNWKLKDSERLDPIEFNLNNKWINFQNTGPKFRLFFFSNSFFIHSTFSVMIMHEISKSLIGSIFLDLNVYKFQAIYTDS